MQNELTLKPKRRQKLKLSFEQLERDMELEGNILSTPMDLSAIAGGETQEGQTLDEVVVYGYYNNNNYWSTSGWFSYGGYYSGSYGSGSDSSWEFSNTGGGYGGESYSQSLKSSDSLLSFLNDWEAYRPTKYDATGKGDWTIGIGHKIKSGENFDNVTLSKEQALDLLRKDLVYFENQVKQYININLSQSQFDALVAFAMNIRGGLANARQLVEAINKCTCNDNELKAIWQRYSNPNDPNIHEGLLNRRKDEFEMFLNNDYTRNH